MLCKLPQTALAMTAILSYDIHCNCCSLGPFLGHSSHLLVFPKWGYYCNKHKNLKINIRFQTNRIWKPYWSFTAYQDYRTDMLKYIICHYIYDVILLLNVFPGVWWGAVSHSFLLFLLLKAKRMWFPNVSHENPCRFLIKILL